MEQNFREKSFYIYKFLSDCLPIYALYIILFKEKGMSITEIALLLSFWSFAVLVIEVPSGVLSDRWNRRYILFIANALKTLCYITWCFSHTFVMFALGFLFWGIAGAFTSGTEEALVYDNLKSEKREEDFSRIYSKGRFYATLGVLIAIISGGILANFISIGAISIASAVICMINFIFIYQLKEKNYYAERVKEEKIGKLKTFFDGAKICIKNKAILISMVFLVFVVSIMDYIEEYDALIINDLELSYIWISVILTVRFIFIAIGNYVASRMETKIKSKNVPFVLAIIASALFLIFSAIWHQYGILVLGLACMIITIVEVIQVNLIQREIDEEGRGTVMSIYSMGQNIFMIVFSLIYALLAGIFSLKMVYIIIGVYAVAGALLLCVINIIAIKKRRRNDI